MPFIAKDVKQRKKIYISLNYRIWNPFFENVHFTSLFQYMYFTHSPLHLIFNLNSYNIPMEGSIAVFGSKYKNILSAILYKKQ